MSLPKSATHGDLEKFLGADQWTKVNVKQRGGRRSQTHISYEKRLPDGRLLRTSISHDRSKPISPGRFSAILRDQLEVTREQYRQTISSGEPADRPSPIDDDDDVAVEHDTWVVAVLCGELHLSPKDIAQLSEEDARKLVHEHWSRHRDT